MLRSGQKANEEAAKAFREELAGQGLYEDDISAIQTISRSDRIDYQVLVMLLNI